MNQSNQPSGKMTIAELASIRQALKLNRVQLAQELGIGSTNLDQWESGKRAVPVQQAWKIRNLYAAFQRRQIEEARQLADIVVAQQEIVRQVRARPSDPLPDPRTFRDDLPVYGGFFCFTAAVACVYCVGSDFPDMEGFWIAVFVSGAIASLIVGVALWDVARRSCRVCRLKPRTRSSMSPTATMEPTNAPLAADCTEPRPI